MKVGLLARLKAKPGKENELKTFLTNALAMAQNETLTPVWFAFQIDNNTFGIFDAFEDEAGRAAHLGGEIASTLMSKADELLDTSPTIEPIDVLAFKV
jgi:quinol monooxygenase YgiN